MIVREASSKVRWLISAISLSKKLRVQSLTTLNFIIIQKDCIQVLVITFQTSFSLFYLSTNLDKFQFRCAYGTDYKRKQEMR